MSRADVEGEGEFTTEGTEALNADGADGRKLEAMRGGEIATEHTEGGEGIEELALKRTRRDGSVDGTYGERL
jgi:hypothetical protein